MNCPQCRTTNRQGAAACVNCGVPFGTAGTPASSGGYRPATGQAGQAGYTTMQARQYSPRNQYSLANQNSPAGQYPPASQYSPSGQYPPAGQQPAGGYQPAGGGSYQPQSAGPAGQFQFDPKRLARVDQIAGGASLVVLISLFLPWFTVSATALDVTYSASGSGTDAHGWLWLVFILDLALIAYLVMRAGWEQQPVRIPFAHAPLLVAATGLQALLVLIAFLVMPSGGPGVSVGWAWGAFVGLLAALLAAVPATRSYLQSRR